MSCFAVSNSRATRSFALATWPAALPRACFKRFRAIVQELFAGVFLLRVNLGAGLLQRVLILLHFICSGRLRRFRSLARADGSRLALVHYFHQRNEKQCPHDAVKNQNDQDCRHSLKEEFAKLVNNLLHLTCVA